jgi:hypothetical protein
MSSDVLTPRSHDGLWQRLTSWWRQLRTKLAAAIAPSDPPALDDRHPYSGAPQQWVDALRARAPHMLAQRDDRTHLQPLQPAEQGESAEPGESTIARVAALRRAGRRAAQSIADAPFARRLRGLQPRPATRRAQLEALMTHTRSTSAGRRTIRRAAAVRARRQRTSEVNSPDTPSDVRSFDAGPPAWRALRRRVRVSRDRDDALVEHAHSIANADRRSFAEAADAARNGTPPVDEAAPARRRSARSQAGSAAASEQRGDPLSTEAVADASLEPAGTRATSGAHDLAVADDLPAGLWPDLPEQPVDEPTGEATINGRTRAERRRREQEGHG